MTRKSAPVKPPRRDRAILVRLTTEEVESLKAAAERDERSLGQWARMTLLRAAGGSK